MLFVDREVMIESSLHADLDLLRVERFYDVSERPHLHGFDRGVNFGDGADNYNGCGR